MWDEIQAAFDLRGDSLESLALIGFRDHVLAQTLGQFLGVGHGFDSAGIDCLHFRDEFEDARQLRARCRDFGIVHRQSRQTGDFLYILGSK